MVIVISHSAHHDWRPATGPVGENEPAMHLNETTVLTRRLIESDEQTTLTIPDEVIPTNEPRLGFLMRHLQVVVGMNHSPQERWTAISCPDNPELERQLQEVFLG